MTIVMVSDAGTDSIDQYDQVIKLLDDTGHGNPPGRQMHVCAPKDNGSYFVVDIWQSEQDLATFAQTLVPLIEQVGGHAPTLQISPAHNMIDGRYRITRSPDPTLSTQLG